MTIYSPNNTPIDFYVYMYIREDYTPYYIGKGTKKRAWESHKRRNNTQVKPSNHSMIKIIAHRLTEAEAIQLEIKLIKEYGRKDLDTGILRNLTNGGEGISGAKLGKMSVASNSKRSIAMTGRTFSDEHKAKLRAAKLGKVLTIEHRQQIASSMSGRKQSESHIRNNLIARGKI